MNRLELSELLRNGENSRVEFKEEDIRPTELAKEIVAFANSEGGTILIGVDDNGRPVGIQRRDLEEWVINICRNNCHPSLIPIFEKIAIDERTIVGVVTIPRREGIVHRTSDGHYYLRVGWSTVRDASTDELSRLFQHRGIVHHDIAPVYGTSLDDLDKNRLQYYLYNILNLRIDIEDDRLEGLLKNRKIMIRVEGSSYLTIAGLLTFGSYPERHLSQAGIIGARFRGEDMDYDMLDKREIEGALVNGYNENGEIISEGVIEQAIRFVQSHTTVSSRMEGVRRVETPQYPIESIREAIVNAVSHRDYTITGSKIRLFIFSDRIEIHSPGRLPNSVTIDDIKATAHCLRNPELYKLMAHHGYVEDIGLGIPEKIIRRMIAHTGKEPKLEETGESFVITIFGGEKSDG